MIANKISRVTGILYRLKAVFPKEVIVTLYKTLIASYIHYGLLVWGMDCNRIEILQKKGNTFDHKQQLHCSHNSII